jgi:hypothetical protein
MAAAGQKSTKTTCVRNAENWELGSEPEKKA